MLFYFEIGCRRRRPEIQTNIKNDLDVYGQSFYRPIFLRDVSKMVSAGVSKIFHKRMVLVRFCDCPGKLIFSHHHFFSLFILAYIFYFCARFHEKRKKEIFLTNIIESILDV